MVFAYYSAVASRWPAWSSVKGVYCAHSRGDHDGDLLLGRLLRWVVIPFVWVCKSGQPPVDFFVPLAVGIVGGIGEEGLRFVVRLIGFDTGLSILAILCTNEITWTTTTKGAAVILFFWSTKFWPV